MASHNGCRLFPRGGLDLQGQDGLGSLREALRLTVDGEDHAFGGFDGDGLVVLIQPGVQVPNYLGNDLVFELGEGVFELKPTILNSLLNSGVEGSLGDVKLPSGFVNREVWIF